MSDAVNETQPTASLMDYLRLFRAPNVFTAMADVTMGFVFVHQSLAPIGSFLCLLAASSLLYTAGMILNDVFDVEVDREERPDRPLPSGRISLGVARMLGFGFLLAGVVLGWVAGFVGKLPVGEGFGWRSGAIATALAACVLLYDGVLKKTPLGPLAMGACRFFNVLLGMSFAANWTDTWSVVGFGPAQLCAAGGIGVYIVGVTWFARTEAVASSKLQLALGTATMMSGIAVLGLIYRNMPAGALLTFDDEFYWMLLLGLLAFTILRRCGIAISNPEPQQVQFAVKHAIFSLIVLDAAVTLCVAPILFSILVLLLLAPTVLLGQYVYST